MDEYGLANQHPVILRENARALFPCRRGFCSSVAAALAIDDARGFISGPPRARLSACLIALARFSLSARACRSSAVIVPQSPAPISRARADLSSALIHAHRVRMALLVTALRSAAVLWPSTLRAVSLRRFIALNPTT
jgi:hypothetical protein